MFLKNDTNLRLGMQGCVLLSLGIVLEQVTYQLFSLYKTTSQAAFTIIHIVGLVSLLGISVSGFGFYEVLRRNDSERYTWFLFLFILPSLLSVISPLPFHLWFLFPITMLLFFVAIDLIMVYFLYGIRKEVANKRLLYLTMFILSTQLLIHELIGELMVFSYILQGGYWFYEVAQYLPISFGVLTVILAIASFFLFRSELKREVRIKSPTRAEIGIESG